MCVLSCAYLYTYLHLRGSYLFIFLRLRSYMQSSGTMPLRFVRLCRFALDYLFVLVLFVPLNPPVCAWLCVCVLFCVCITHLQARWEKSVYRRKLNFSIEGIEDITIQCVHTASSRMMMIQCNPQCCPVYVVKWNHVNESVQFLHTISTDFNIVMFHGPLFGIGFVA